MFDVFKTQRGWFSLIMAAAVFTIFASTGMAQEGDAEAAGGGDKSFIQVFLDGGSTMWVLLIGSILTITFAIEGFIKFRVGRLAPPAVMALLQDAVNQGNYQQAVDVANANPCFASRVASAGLQRLGKGRDVVENAMMDTSVLLSTNMKANMNYLSVIGVVAPMLGLYGTVLGMIGAFAELGKGGADMGALSGEISVVLVTTAGGLVVAIPAFILYFIIRNFAQSALSMADSEVKLLMEDIPYEQLSGLSVGGAGAPPAGGAPAAGMPGGQPPMPGQPMPGSYM